MDPQSWDRVASVFLDALEQAPAERLALLERACEGDPALRDEVEAMLAVETGGVELLIERAVGSDLAPGTRLGPYRIEGLVGRGGMAEVYRAERVDGAYAQTVAVKVLRPGYRAAEAVRRFRVERQLLARLVHPDIAAILDGGTAADGRPYLVLQYVEGVPITDYCEREGLALEARLRLFRRVAEAVQFAHGRLIVHRDLKPSNILVQADGSPRLLDFGIAKLLDPGPDDELPLATRPETRLLTPEHAAPEQLRGEPVSTATDVYGLGVLLYTLLAGRRPFPSRGRTEVELARAILEETPPAPSSVASRPGGRRKLRGDLDRIVLKALRKESDRRYASAGQFAEDIDRHLAGLPVRAHRDSVRYRARKFVARNRVWVAVGCALAVILGSFTASLAWQGRRVALERDRAERERAAAEGVLGIMTGLLKQSNPRIVPGGDTLRVAAFLDEAEHRINGLTDHPDRQMQMWRVLGNMHAARGEYDRAKAILARSWERQRRTNGADDPAAAQTYHELARVVLWHEGARAAQPMLDSSVARLRRILGEDDPAVAGALKDLAVATTEPRQKRVLLDQAIELQSRVSGADSIAIAELLAAEAGEKYGLGQLSEALALYEASLRILERRLPEEHPDRLEVTRNLAKTLIQLGEWARAGELARAVLKRALRTGLESEAVADDRHGLAMLDANLGRLDEAEAGFRQAIAMYRRVLAPDHEQIGNARRNLALTIAFQGRVAEGLALLDSVVEARRRKHGPHNLYVGQLTAQRAQLLLWLGRTEAAAAALHEGRRAIRDTAPIGHAYWASVQVWLGMLAFEQGDAGEAARQFAGALEQRRTNLPASHPKVAEAGCGLGVALARQQRFDEARPYLDEACPIYERWGLDDPLINRWAREARREVASARQP